MSETRPYGMIVVAVFGLLSAFIYAWEPAPLTSADVQVAQAPTTMAAPAGSQNFPVQAFGQAGQQAAQAPAAPQPSPIPTVMPRGYMPPPVQVAAPMTGPPPRTGMPLPPHN